MKLRSNRRSYEKRRKLPKNSGPKNPKVLAASLAAIVISVVVLCMVIVIGVIGFSADKKEVATSSKTVEGAVHSWFILDSDTVTNETASEKMEGTFRSVDNVGYVPTDGIIASLGGTATYDKDSGVVKFSGIGKRAKVTVGSKKMKKSLFGSAELDAKVFEEKGVVYVPARSFFEALGYGVSYTAGTNRLDVFAPDKDDKAPKASLSVEKDTYQAGEKVSFVAEGKSPQGYEIVEEKWENHAERYFESGEVKVSYAVKDYKGNWSKTVSKTFTVEGEYSPAESIPVLAYFYITADADNISKVITKEENKTVKDPADPTGQKTIVKKEKVKKTIRGPYYGDDMVISADQFEDEMDYLADNGYQTITVSEYLSYVSSGQMPPENSVMILFANGYSSTYSIAYPILKERGLKANVAPQVKVSEDRTPLKAAVDAEEDGAEAALEEFDDECSFPSVTFADLKEMIADGTFEVGCVSYNSNRYSEDGESLLAAPATIDGTTETDEQYAARVKDDLTAAITVLCDNLGEENVPFFIYPFGETSEVLEKAVKDAGFSAAFIKGDGYNTMETDIFHLERTTVTQDMSIWDFEDLL